MHAVDGRFSPIATSILRDQVTDAIRNAIAGNVLRPGERIVERDLARELGVSRLPIREAIRQLEHEGLLVSVPRRGTFVAQVSAGDIHEIFALRAILEGLAIRLVTQRGSADEHLRLQRAVDEMNEANAREEYAALFEMDTRFHTLLVTCAQHRRLFQHWSQVDTQWRSLVRLDRDHLVAALGRFGGIHQILVDAIVSGDPDHAERAAREHVANAEQNVIRLMHERNQGELSTVAAVSVSPAGR
ncbi:MAG: GntR family transcriptional regulator [Chloroflexi bacterium]|nr:GntR family transcriptional regulator [Chloroflexota bacterium]